MRYIMAELTKVFGAIALTCGFFIGAMAKAVVTSGGSAEELMVVNTTSAILIFVGCVLTYVGIWKEVKFEGEHL